MSSSRSETSLPRFLFNSANSELHFCCDVGGNRFAACESECVKEAIFFVAVPFGSIEEGKRATDGFVAMTFGSIEEDERATDRFVTVPF